jgi:D-arabinose 1-dehydrogenase-like Zn-dependent alcohol dehydrogenase
VLAASICHTDLHLHDGFFDLGRGRKIAMTERGVTLPHTPGHETAGEVVALGPEATGMSVGQRVLVYPWIGCDHCALCAAGEGHLCASPRFLGVFRDGGFATHLRVPHSRYLFPLEHDVDAARAAPLACSGVTTYSALTKARRHAGDGPVAIIGAGGLGLMSLALAAMLGMPPPVAIEPDAARRRAAIEAGAAKAFSNDAPGVEAAHAALSGGAAAVIDFVGNPETVALGVELLRKGGKLIVVGMFGGELVLPMPTLVLRALSLEGSYVGSLAEMRALMQLVAAKGFPPVPLTRVALGDVNTALADMRAGRVIGRAVLQPDKSTEPGMIE